MKKEHRDTSKQMLVLKEKASCLTRGWGGTVIENNIPRYRPKEYLN